MGVKIKAFGHFVGDKILGNAELAERYGITEDWIIEKTGIEERRYFTEGAVSDMIVKAALDCFSKTDIGVEEIDCIIVATMTPDYHCPSTAALVHKKLGTKNAWGFDIMAACSGYIYGLQLAAALIETKAYKTILVCGADKMSSCIDPTDRKTVLVLGDGAGVSVLQYSDTENNIQDTICRLDSTYAMDVNMLVGGSCKPLTNENIVEANHYLRFGSKLIFEHGVELMVKIIVEIIEKNRIEFEDIDYIVTHQSNKRMIEAVAERFGLPIEKFIINVEHIGNTSAGSVPIAISDALETSKLKGNERLLLVAIGAGFTYGASLLNLNMN